MSDEPEPKEKAKKSIKARASGAPPDDTKVDVATDAEVDGAVEEATSAVENPAEDSRVPEPVAVEQAAAPRAAAPRAAAKDEKPLARHPLSFQRRVPKRRR